MDERAAALLIERAFPDLRVDIIRSAGEGDFSLAYTLNGEWLVRLARNDEASRALRVEAALIPRLAPSLKICASSENRVCSMVSLLSLLSSDAVSGAGNTLLEDGIERTERARWFRH